MVPLGYECPNGHRFAIGDCGQAASIGRCNECGATIGGQNHQLHRGNRQASNVVRDAGELGFTDVTLM